MKIEHKNNIYEFLHYKDENCWVSQKRIDTGSFNIFMEIHLKDFLNAEFDWNILTSFVNYIENKLPNELDPHSKNLLTSVSKINHWTDAQDIDKYSFRLEGIFYKEPKLPVFHIRTLNLIMRWFINYTIPATRKLSIHTPII